MQKKKSNNQKKNSVQEIKIRQNISKKMNQTQNPMKKYVNYRKTLQIKTLTRINEKYHMQRITNQTKENIEDINMQLQQPFLVQSQSQMAEYYQKLLTAEKAKNQKHLARSSYNYDSIKISMEQFLEVKQSSINDEYEFKQKIGQGAFGTVFRAICKKSQQQRAIKILKGKYLKGDNKQKLLAEMTLLSKLQHPSIIKIYDLFKNNNNYYVVMQYCKGGSIFQFLSSNKNQSQKIIISIMRQILSALSYLHSMNIVHRDMKLDNIVFIGNQADLNNLQIKIRIIDFGTAVQTKYKVTKNYGIAGTYSYMAPQVLDKVLTEQSDIWSSGVIMAFLLTGIPPFKGMNQDKTIQKIKTKEINYSEAPFNSLSDDAKSLLASMLNRNIYKRISASQALKHPWFSANHHQVPLTLQNVQRLKNFCMQNNFVSVVESFLILKKINQEQRQYFSSIFQSVDIDGNGTIEISEFLQLMKINSNENYDESQIKKLINSIDRNKQGRIDFNEFMIAMYDREKLFVKESLNDAFDFFDKDKSGYLQKKEINNILKGSNNGQVQYFLKKMDLDKNNIISRDQFINYLSQF